MLVSNPAQLVGDYTNPILKPLAAEAVKKKGEIELGGMVSPTPTIQCWPEPVPYIFNGVAMQMLVSALGIAAMIGVALLISWYDSIGMPFEIVDEDPDVRRAGRA